MLTPLLKAACRMFPFRSGTMTITKRLSRWLPRAGQRVVVMRRGVPLMVDMADINGRQLFLFGSPDRRIVDICRALAPTGEVFLDIGANYGGISLLMPTNCECHAFEPNPVLAGRLSRAVEDGGLGNLNVHTYALMDRAGKMPLYIPAGHSGAGSLVSGRGEAVEVEARAIDSIGTEVVRGRSFGAKVDIEGAEELILPWLLGQENQRYVVFEAKHMALDSVWPLMEAYTVYGVERGWLTTPLTRVTSLAQAADYHDLVVVRSARPDPPRRIRAADLGAIVTGAGRGD